jgi:hypothetical protein
MLAPTMVLINTPGSARSRNTATRRQAAPGDLNPQCGQCASLKLISRLQLGHRIDCRCRSMNLFL